MLLNEIKHTIGAAGRSDYRKMGVSFGILLLLIAGYCFNKDYSASLYIGQLGVVLLLSGLLFPSLLKPFYNGWMALALSIGYIMSRILLSLIFFLIFTPVGLVMRLLSKDPLSEKYDHSASSYWIKREKQDFDPKEAERQF
jgi:hypothetical protein